MEYKNIYQNCVNNTVDIFVDKSNRIINIIRDYDVILN